MSGEPLASGAEIAPGYEVLAHLSRGRRLDVYDVWSHRRGCRCVIKTIRPEPASELKARESLLREGRLLQRLTHPHLVRGYETIPGPVPMIVMETLGGQTLAHLIEEERRELSPAELAQLGLQLGSVVRYLHGSGFLHLDLKPANVIAEAGRARLIDLSLARPPGPAPAGTGTWCYLAPEQALGRELGPAADVWGLGAVLHEAATGEHAFGDPEESASSTEGPLDPASAPGTWSSDDAAEAEFPQLRERAAPVGSTRALPPGMGELIDSCLEPDPRARPTIEALLAGLEVAGGVPGRERRWSGAPVPA